MDSVYIYNPMCEYLNIYVGEHTYQNVTYILSVAIGKVFTN